MTAVMNSMIAPQSKTMSRVLPSCFVSPFTRVRSESAAGSRSVSMQGPSGEKRVEALAARELHVLLLQVAGGDVVRAGEAEDDVCASRRGGRSRAGLPMTMASSPSKSTRCDCGGRTIVPFGSSTRGRRFQKDDRLATALRCRAPSRARRSCGRRRRFSTASPAREARHRRAKSSHSSASPSVHRIAAAVADDSVAVGDSDGRLAGMNEAIDFHGGEL